MCEPEPWVMMHKKLQNEKRAEWKRDDLVEYGKQDLLPAAFLKAPDAVNMGVGRTR